MTSLALRKYIFLYFFLSCLSICTPLHAQTSNTYQAKLSALLLESGDLLQAGKPEEALLLLKEQESKYSSHPEFMNNLAIAYLGSAKPQEALSILKQMVDADPIFSIITHNLLEMQLQIAGAGKENIEPILFMQTVGSFFEQELANNTVTDTNTVNENIANSNTTKPNITNQSSANRQASEQSVSVTNSDDALFLAIEVLTNAWASAWSNKRFNQYIGFYSDNFVSQDGLDYIRWKAQRKNRLSRPGKIEITLSNLRSSQSQNNNIISIQFIQEYRSKTYRDKVEKRLKFQQQQGRWKIISEETIRKL